MLEKLRNAPPAPGTPGAATRALILAPTRELVVQIAENAHIYGKYLPLKIATVFGGVGENPQIDALQRGTDLVVATPGRLLDLMSRGYGRFSHLRFLVLDEADRMLDMGFLPSIQRIVRSLPKRRQTLLFSATFSREIEAISEEFLRHPQRIEVGRRANPAETVQQITHEVPMALKSALLIHLLEASHWTSVLVFTRTKHGADRLARKLEARNISTAALHSDRSQNQRLRALKDFREGKVRVLVATDIAARGIDVDGISHVVNYDFPMHAEDYVHRIGRTGRAQAKGDAVSFVTPEDRDSVRTVEKLIGRPLRITEVPDFDYTQVPEVRGGNRPSQPSSHRGSQTSGRNPQRGRTEPSPRPPQSSPSFRGGTTRSQRPRGRTWRKSR